MHLSDGTVSVGSTIGIKRQREELDDSSFDDFHKLSAAVMCEVSTAMAGVQPNDVVSLAVQLCSAGKICCYGVGREKFVMHSFVVRLRHLGLNAYMVGGIDTPVVASGDVMLGSAGPSFYNTVSEQTNCCSSWLYSKVADSLERSDHAFSDTLFV